MERNGPIDTDDLLSRLVWGAHAHRQFPAIEGPTVLPEPPISVEDEEKDASAMAVDGAEIGSSNVQKIAPLRRLFPGHRLYQTHRGPRLASDIRHTTIYNAVHAMRLGTTQLPYHLQFPIQNYPKFHQLARRRGHMGEVFFIQYDRTGNRIFTGSDDWLIKIWSARTGLLVQTLRGHKGAITYICLDPTNRYLASASEDNSIRIWSLATYATVAVIQAAHTKPVVELSWSSAPQINAVVSTALDGVIKVWEFRSPPPGKQGDIETLLGRDTSLRFRDSMLECNNSPCQSGPLSPCGTRALVSCKDGSVRILALNPLRQLQRIVAHNSNVPTTAWSHNTSRFLTASDDGTAKVFEYLNSEKGWVLLYTLSVLEIHAPGPKPKMYEARWSLNDDYIILVYQRTPLQQNRQIKVFCAHTGRLLGSLEGHDNDIHAMDVHPLDHRIIATGGYDQKIIFWNLETLRPAAELFLPNYEDEESPILAISFSPDGTQIAVSDLIGTFTLFGIGPTDTFKGPTEQFFMTDYQETTMDGNGYVVDTETQLAPHMTPRTVLCFRGGRSHDIPYVLPPLRDPSTEVPLDELTVEAQQRAEAAQEEDMAYNVGEPHLGGPVAVPQVGLGVGLPGQPGAEQPVAARTRGGQPPVANTPAAAVASPARPAVARANAPAMSRAATAVMPATTAAATANNGSGNFTRLRRNNTATAPAAPAPAAASGEARRPPRRAASRGVSALLEMNQDIDEASRQAILDLEDELEEDFSDIEAYGDDESISEEDQAERDNFDLYWSGDEATSHFKSPGDRRNMRESSRLSSRTSGPSAAVGTRSSANSRRVLEEDSDEDYGRPRRPKPRPHQMPQPSPSPTPIINLDSNGSPIPKRSRGRPPKASTLLQRAITAAQLAIANGETPAINLTGLSYDQQQQYHQAVAPKDEEADLDIMSDSDSDEDVAIESDYEDDKPKRKSGNPKKDTHRPKPPSYPPWVLQTTPSAIYCPQLGDEVVFAKPGYDEYIRTQQTFFPNIAAMLPHNLPTLSYCTITNIQFDAQPFLHAIITLSTIAPQPAIPPVLYAEQGPPPPPQLNEAERKALKASLAQRPSPPDCCFISMQETALSLAQTHRQVSGPSTSFTVYYHGGASQVPDYLILASRFNQGMSQEWYPGKYVSAWIADESDVTRGDYYPGTVLEANVMSPWEALTIIWEDGDALHMSPWEVDVVDPAAVALAANGKIPPGPRLPIYSEMLDPGYADRLAQTIEAYIHANSTTVSIFMNEVPLDEYPSYLSTNPWPVYISLIVKRLRGGWYRTISALQRDIECLHSNSVAFNGESTPISLDARRIADAFQHLLSQSGIFVMLITKRNERGEDSDDKGKNSKKRKRSSDDEEEDDDLVVEAFAPAKQARPAANNSTPHQSRSSFELSHLAAAASDELTTGPPNAPNGAAVATSGLRVNLRANSHNAAHAAPPAAAAAAPSSNGRPVRASRTRTSFKETEWDDDEEEDDYFENDSTPARRRR